jgi:FkbM family methyltransferase
MLDNDFKYITIFKMIFFDIGANIGKWSLANLYKCDKIVAIEASPTTFDKLLQNIENNQKIICLNYVVCSSNEEYISFYNSTAHTISTINKDWLDSEKSRFYKQFTYNEIKCKTISIDKLIEMYGTPELIKIDVEGGEFECISSLTQKVKQICFEWASETNDITFKCLDYLVQLGYTKFSIQIEDNYVYRPEIYEHVNNIKDKLKKTTPKLEWGMIWAL